MLDPEYYAIQEKTKKVVVFPLRRELTDEEIKQFQGVMKSNVLIDQFIFSQRERRPTTLQEALSNILPKELHPWIPSAIDFVGDLAILDLPSPLLGYKEVVGKGIMEMNPHVAGVFRKVGSVSGQFRLRQVERLTGVSRTTTIHHENGCRFHVDIAQTYFSGRLSTERLRVGEQIKTNTVVLDMFAGVGPFSILAAKQGATVFAVDINPQAIQLLNQNILLNKVQNQVTIFTGDIRTVKNHLLKNHCDHVIMNLPGHAIQFLDKAIEALKPNGGIIHLYCFQREPDLINNTRNSVITAIGDAKGRVDSLIDIRKVKMTAPHEWQMCVEMNTVPL